MKIQNIPYILQALILKNTIHTKNKWNNFMSVIISRIDVRIKPKNPLFEVLITISFRQDLV